MDQASPFGENFIKCIQTQRAGIGTFILNDQEAPSGAEYPTWNQLVPWFDPIFTVACCKLDTLRPRGQKPSICIVSG